MAADDLVTTREAADVLGVTVATVNRWATAGRLPRAMQLPGNTGANLFRRADVEALLAGDAEQASA